MLLRCVPAGDGRGQAAGVLMNRAYIFQQIADERIRQERKYGHLSDDWRTLAGYLLVLQGELDEAMQAWRRAEARHALDEVLQVAAVAVACLERHLED